MVLGWLNGENTVIKGILDKIATLENIVKLLESENEAQKQEILKLRDGNACTEWRDVLMKKKKITENQIDILNAVGSEQKERAYFRRNRNKQSIARTSQNKAL